MIDQLVTEKEEMIKHKDFCVDSIQQNEADTANKQRQRDDHKYKIGELTDEIKTLAKQIADLKAEIASSYVSLKRAGEDREVQNADFQRTVADQRATQKLLVGALDILKGFYDKMSLVQHKAALKAPAGAPPPPGFKKREGASSGGVMGMMQQIIDDAKAMEAEALQGEEEAQTSYESFVTDLNASIVDMQKSIVHKTETKASKTAEKAQKEIELEEIQRELEELRSANQDLHADCDYTLKNFDAKQASLDDEIMALKESVSIFSGASFGALIQTFKK
jgi:chromosome segregation ATPase